MNNGNSVECELRRRMARRLVEDYRFTRDEDNGYTGIVGNPVDNGWVDSEIDSPASDSIRR